MTIYLDCNATTPLEPAVRDVVVRFLVEEFGNEGSRSHDYGLRAKRAVQEARHQVAAVVGANSDEIVFTSGATESNNLAILGLAPEGEKTGRKHIVSTQIEHKAVLEPLQALTQRGFQVTLVLPTRGGWVEPEAIREALRPNTLLVSVMHVNNETGVVQPLTEIASLLGDHPAYFHTDAAQGFGKEDQLRNPRLDLISVSGHKIYGPKGVGALITRRRDYDRPPLTPLMFGGGQERGLRPGTIPVPLVVGLGRAAKMCENREDRSRVCARFKEGLIEALSPLNPVIHGDRTRTLPHVVNLSFPGLDSEAVMLVLKEVVAISNGSACTSASYEPSHVLRAMGLTEQEIQTALRWSWYHMTDDPNWEMVLNSIKSLI